jgi:hypothetical protein
MDKRTFGLTGGIVILVGVATYFVIEAVSLHRKNKKQRAIDNEVNALQEVKLLIDASADDESKSIIDETLENERTKIKIIKDKKNMQQQRIKTASQWTFNLLPAILRFFGSVVLSPPERQEKEYTR